MNIKNRCKRGLQPISHRYVGSKIQPIVAIFKITEGGENVPLVIEGAGRIKKFTS